jgi:hypothetical protein
MVSRVRQWEELRYEVNMEARVRRRGRAQAQQAHPLQGAADWRERMQKNHSADRSIEQQVRRLTKELDLTPEQQEKVRQLSHEHNDRIQRILDTAPPTLTYQAFTAQVYAISQEYSGTRYPGAPNPGAIREAGLRYPMPPFRAPPPPSPGSLAP